MGRGVQIFQEIGMQGKGSRQNPMQTRLPHVDTGTRMSMVRTTIVRLDVRTNFWASSKLGLCIQKRIKSDP